jgi:GntR family transcriptional regulator
MRKEKEGAEEKSVMSCNRSLRLLYFAYNKWRLFMVIRIDVNSGEAIYIQLRDQIIMGIATSVLREGDSLPSVRQMADEVGINMHTVNKAYSVLKEEGFLTVDRRGTVIVVDSDRKRALDTLRQDLRIALARAKCRGVTRDEVHDLIDEMMEDYR